MIFKLFIKNSFLYQILQDDSVATLFSYYFFQAATTSDKFLPVCGGSARKKNKIYSCQLGHFRHRRGAFFNPKMYQKTRKKLSKMSVRFVIRHVNQSLQPSKCVCLKTAQQSKLPLSCQPNNCQHQNPTRDHNIAFLKMCVCVCSFKPIMRHRA